MATSNQCSANKKRKAMMEELSKHENMFVQARSVNSAEAVNDRKLRRISALILTALLGTSRAYSCSYTRFICSSPQPLAWICDKLVNSGFSRNNVSR